MELVQGLAELGADSRQKLLVGCQEAEWRRPGMFSARVRVRVRVCVCGGGSSLHSKGRKAQKASTYFLPCTALQVSVLRSTSLSEMGSFRKDTHTLQYEAAKEQFAVFLFPP